MTPLEHAVDRSYTDDLLEDLSVSEPEWLAKTRRYVDETVGRPLGKLGLFAADSRRRRTYLKENVAPIRGVSKVSALTGAGSQPAWALETLDESVEYVKRNTGPWSDSILDGFDSDDISKFHIRFVDPVNASGTFLKGGGSMFALHQLGVPPEYAAKGVGAAIIGKGVQAGVRNYIFDAYDEHTVAPFNYLMSPSPWAWLGTATALKTGSAVYDLAETGARSSVGKMYENGVSEAAAKTYIK